MGLFKSLVLSTFPNPTIALVIPLTIPVNVGEAVFAFKFKASCVAFEIGLPRSVVLSTSLNPTSDFIKPTGVVITGLVKVLLVKVSVPAKVAKVPVVGNVTFVFPTEVNVVL